MSLVTSGGRENSTGCLGVNGLAGRERAVKQATRLAGGADVDCVELWVGAHALARGLLEMEPCLVEIANRVVVSPSSSF